MALFKVSYTEKDLFKLFNFQLIKKNKFNMKLKLKGMRPLKFSQIITLYEKMLFKSD